MTRKPIDWKFIVSVLFFILIVFSIIFIWKEKDADASLVTQQELVRLSRLVVSQYEIFVDQTRQTLILISKLPQVRGDDPDICSQTLSALLTNESRYINFGVIEPNGRLFCSALPYTKGIEAGDRLYFQKAMESEGFAVGDFQIGRVTHKPSVNFGYAFKEPNGEIAGVVFTALNLDWLKSFAEEADLPAGSELIMTDSQGVVLLRYPENEIGVEAKEISFPIEQLEYVGEKIGVLKIKDANGEKRFMVVAPLKIPDQEGFLHIIISVPKKSIVSIPSLNLSSIYKSIFNTIDNQKK